MKNFKITQNLEEENIWFEECQQRQIYFIYIKEKQKYATIYWDHISLNLSRDLEIETIHVPIKEKNQGMINVFLKHATNIDKNKYPLKANYYGNSLVGQFNNIPKDIAPILAEDLANYLNNLVESYINK